MLTSEQRAIIPPERRQHPYPGMPFSYAIPTGAWWEHFIKPAERPGVHLRLVAEGNTGSAHFQRICNELGVKPDLATIINGSGAGGKGVLYSVRRGTIPALPVMADQWFHSVMGEADKDDPSRNSLRKEMVYDGWMNVTQELLNRNMISLTPPIHMLLGES